MIVKTYSIAVGVATLQSVWFVEELIMADAAGQQRFDALEVAFEKSQELSNN